jgi:hypothetical protein
MRFVLLVMAAALAAGCGSAAVGSVGMERYGIALEVAEGWDAEISRGLVRIARGDVSVELYEYEAASADEATYFKQEWPLELAASSFGAPKDENDRLVSVSGRLFSVFPVGRPSGAELDEINRSLATIEVEPGDFYPGSVRPVELPERPGWHVVSSGATPRYAYGEFVHSAAATIPYRNDPPDLPPVRTLEALPRDGILVWVGLSRDTRVPPSRIEAGTAFERSPPPPYRVADLERVIGWEGQVRDIPDYRLWAVTGDRYLLDVRVYFGRAQPTEAMLAEADAMLFGLRLPDWGPWELEDA